MKHFTASALLAAVVWTPGAVFGQDPAHANILILLADDVGIDKIGCYQPGTTPPPPSTPVIDGLAANGIRFTQAYANPLCSPTRACMQTGRYGFRTGIGTIVRSNNTATPLGPMSPSEITLPEMLDAGQSGYRHGLIGKWHLGYHQKLGVAGDPFDQGYGYFAGTKGNFNTRSTPPEHYENWPKTVNGVTTTSNLFTTVDNIDEALGFIRAQNERPWLCFVAFNAPHAPLYRPPGSSLPHVMPIAGEPAWPYFNAMMEHMDSEIGRLMTGIGAMDPDMLAHTLILFAGDNGTTSPSSGPQQLVFPPFDPTRCKGTVFEGGIHVPLIASGYLVDQPGRTSDALVHLVDTFATIADIAGVDLTQPNVIPPGRTLDSISFLPLVADAAAQGARTRVFCEFFDVNNPAPGTFMAKQRSLRDTQFKLLRLDHMPPFHEEFYDLQNDPFETDDILAHPGGGNALEQQAYQTLSAELDALLISP